MRISDFLFEREGKYKPESKEVAGLKRIEKIDFSGNFHIAQKPSKTNMILIRNGDLVISGINVSKGAMGIYRGDEDVTATIHYSSYTFDTSKIDVEYFKRFLKSAEFIQLLQEQVKGGIKTEIKPKHILPLEINLPDIEEQKKIVAHFKNIETEDNELKTEITHQKILLKKLRQQILQEAIEGKLTKKWRSDNPNIEPASKLLTRIQAEKTQLIKDKKIKPQKPLPPISKEEKPFDLPDGWVWCRLGDLIYESPKNGYSPKTVDFPTSTKTLKLGATTSGRFIETEIKYINEEIKKESFLWLNDRDILIQRGNSIDFVGVSAVYNDESNKFVYPDLMMKIKPVKLISETFLHHALMSPLCRKYFQNKATGAQKSMPKINQGVVSNTLIPLCSQLEQKAIVTKVEKLFALCDKLETQITNNQTHAKQLMQAVLKEAFSQSVASKNLEVVAVQTSEKNTEEEKAFVKRKMLAAYIIKQSLEDSQFGDTKFEKLLYLSDYHYLQRNLGQQYYAKTAGPYDNKFTYPFFKQVIKAKWFIKQKTGKINRILAGENINKSQNTYNFFSPDELNKVNELIALFKKCNYEQPEIVATLYAVWNNRIIKNEEISDELLKADFLAWDSHKIEYKERILPALDWMRKKNIIPNGWGKIISKPN
jgi:type I restriction enzyme S subunit